MSESRAAAYAALFLRAALAAAFLAAVTDRFGLWGPPGAANVAWGDFARFETYAAKLNWFMPAALIPAIAWTATVLETGLALALLLGAWTRAVALVAGALLLVFALAMTIALGIKSPLNGSVYSAGAGAFLLAHVQRHVWALDNVIGRQSQIVVAPSVHRSGRQHRWLNQMPLARLPVLLCKLTRSARGAPSAGHPLSLKR